MSTHISIRLATLADCESILDIYAHYVQYTAVSFEYEVPTIEEMKRRMMATQINYPYLVCTSNATIIGYTYATRFRERAAYQWSPECAIYLHKDYVNRGLGQTLYLCLFDMLKLQGYFQVFGGVALPNKASVNLHVKCGFKRIGVFKEIGYKHKLWHSTQWFQLNLQPVKLNPKKPRTIDSLLNTNELVRIFSYYNTKLKQANTSDI